jgi:hypothetical protein
VPSRARHKMQGRGGDALSKLSDLAEGRLRRVDHNRSHVRDPLPRSRILVLRGQVEVDARGFQAMNRLPRGS